MSLTPVLRFSQLGRLGDLLPKVLVQLMNYFRKDITVVIMPLPDIYPLIGQSIQNLRRERGLAQGQLAEKAGISRTYLGQIEAGKKRVAVDILQKITNALNISLSELFAMLD